MSSPQHNDSVFQIMGADLLSRLAWFTLRPQKIMTAGVSLQNELQAFYPSATFHQDTHNADLLAAHFCEDVLSQLKKFQKQLREEGVLLLTAFGPDTLKELGEVTLPKRIDMHDLGDALVQAGFLHPVMEVLHYTLSYRNKEQLLHDLQALTGLSHFDNLTPNDDGKWTLTLEVVFGHAFAGSKMITRGQHGEVRVSVDMLKNSYS